MPKCAARARTRSVAARTHDRVETVGAANANNNEAEMFVPFLSLVLLLVVTSGASAFQNEGERVGPRMMSEGRFR